jgi:TRAP-type C4-dicarboxylate transport system permease small subunit
MRHTVLRVLQALLSVVRAVAVVLLVCSVGLNFANIVGRYFLHESISWAEEGMLFLMVGCVFLGSANAVWSGHHIRMDVFVRLMPLKVQEWLGLFSEAVLLVTSVALVVFAWPTIRQLQAFDQRSLAADIPLVIPQGMIPLGLSLMALLAACRIILGMWRDEPHTPRL